MFQVNGSVFSFWAGTALRVNVWYPASEESKIIALLQKLNVPWARCPVFEQKRLMLKLQGNGFGGFKLGYWMVSLYTMLILICWAYFWWLNFQIQCNLSRLDKGKTMIRF